MHGINRLVVVLIAVLFFLPINVVSESGSINTGVTDSGNEILFLEELSDGNFITINDIGEISKQSIYSGILQPIWVYETNISVNSANIDNGLQMLAITTNNGYFVFNLNTIEIDFFNNITDIPTDIDWDSQGHIWLAYNTGLRKAVEYDGQSVTSNETGVIGQGFFDFQVLDDDTIAFAGIDKKVHIYGQDGQLIRRLSEPINILTMVSQDSNDNLIAGTNSGELYSYDSNWQVSSLDLGVDESIIHMQESDNGFDYIIGTNSGTVLIINKSTFSVVETYSISGAIVRMLDEFGGRFSIICNVNGQSNIYFFDIDSDGDGYSDSQDEYPEDQSQYVDSDGDGYGDNYSGTDGDHFPNDPTQYLDSDGDGYGDNTGGNNSDKFPSNEDQWNDSDDDGYGDNSNGLLGDKYPNDRTQWNDTDGDGYGDNPDGTEPDSCPNETGYSNMLDRYGCLDSDSDGYANQDDALPNDKTQWLDGDLDGYGDNPAPANSPDSCPLTSGNSTKQQFRDGTYIPKYGCVDSDGDGYEDNSDDFPNNSLEWFDYDLDGVGSNTDYNDTSSQIQTLRDYCILSGDNSTTCKSFTDLDYQEYLNREKNPGDIDLSYSAWLAKEQITNLDEEQETLGSTIKQVAIIGGVIFLIATVIILLISFVVSKKKTKELVKRYGVPYEPKDTTASQEALEGTAGSSALGGIESDDAWDDEIEEMDFTKSDEESDELVQPTITAEELYDSESEISDIAGIEVSSEEISDEEVSAMLKEEDTVDEKPTNSPPLPASGLPQGWTMEQWEWYGHEWLSKFGDQ